MKCTPNQAQAVLKLDLNGKKPNNTASDNSHVDEKKFTDTVKSTFKKAKKLAKKNMIDDYKAIKKSYKNTVKTMHKSNVKSQKSNPFKKSTRMKSNYDFVGDFGNDDGYSVLEFSGRLF